MIFVVKTMEDVSPSLIAVLKRAKQIVGYEEALSLIEESALPEHTDDVTVGMGVNGCTYKTLSPKQVLTKGTSLTFITQVMNNAINHDTAQTVEMEQGKNYWVLETEDDVKKLWGYFVSRTPDAVAIDIETGGNADEEPWGVQWLLSISLTVDDAHTYVIPEELAETATTGAFIDALCNDIPVTTIGHNSTYDAGLLSHRLGIKVYFDEDTLMMHFCMNNTAQEHGLKPLAQRIFGAPDWDSANKKYTKGGAHFENIPRDQLYRYNAYDTYWTMRLYHFFREQMEHDPAIRAYYRYRMEVTKVLQDLQANGIVIDTAKLEELGEKFTAEFEEARGVLREVTGNDDFNPNSPKQVKDWLSSQGVPVHTADKEALTELLDSDNADAAKFASALLTFRRANKQYSTYVVGISKRVGEDGRIHPTYLPHGAKSGRLSSRNPNAQNITRDSGIKEAFVAPEGYCIVSCDYSQAELRTVAELAADEHMIAAFQPGAPDFFDNLMTKIYPEEFPTIEDYEEFDRENHLAAKNKRAIIKGTVYGANYGRGVPAIAKALKVPVSDAQAVMDSYYSTYPNLKKWQDSVREAVGKDRLAWRLITPFGLRYRQEVVTQRTRNKSENEALSFVPQSTANDICLHAAIEVNKRLDEYGARLVCSVHDALYVESPIDNAQAVGAMMEREMAGAAELVFHRAPFVAEAEYGNNFQEV